MGRVAHCGDDPPAGMIDGMDDEARPEFDRGRRALRSGVAAPVRIEGELVTDGAWALDRFLAAPTGVTDMGDLLERAWAQPEGRAAVHLGVQMAAVLSERSWPADLVVVPVPSASATVEALARVIGGQLGCEVRRLLVRRRFGLRPGRRRIGVVPRYMCDHVLLVDDVVRSGDTLDACARALRRRGVLGVWSICATFEPVASPPRRLVLSPAEQAALDVTVPVVFDGRALDVRVLTGALAVAAAVDDGAAAAAVAAVDADALALELEADARLFDQDAEAIDAGFYVDTVIDEFDDDAEWRAPMPRVRLVPTGVHLDDSLWDLPLVAEASVFDAPPSLPRSPLPAGPLPVGEVDEVREVDEVSEVREVEETVTVDGLEGEPDRRRSGRRPRGPRRPRRQRS